MPIYRDALDLSLLSLFGDEWTVLSPEDRHLIKRDVTEDGGVDDLRAYRRNIGAGNLEAYARVMRVRFRQQE